MLFQARHVVVLTLLRLVDSSTNNPVLASELQLAQTEGHDSATQLRRRALGSTGNRLTWTSRPIALFVVFLSISTVAISSSAQGQNRGTAQTGATVSSGPAEIRFWNRHISTMRTDLAGGTPHDRAERAIEKLRELPLGTTIEQIELHPITVE